MPAKDKYHDVVKRALEKAGWKILNEDFQLIVSKRNLWIDLQAESEDQTSIILVEVKTFENVQSPVNY